MPEQITMHPEVTLQVLQSAGAVCGERLAQQILMQCPAERFCKLPGGELRVYGLPDAPRMTKISTADWSALASSTVQPVPPPAPSVTGLAVAAAVALVIGATAGVAIGRRRR